MSNAKTAHYVKEVKIHACVCLTGGDSGNVYVCHSDAIEPFTCVRWRQQYFDPVLREGYKYKFRVLCKLSRDGEEQNDWKIRQLSNEFQWAVFLVLSCYDLYICLKHFLTSEC